MNWLLLDGKLCIILFIADDLGCESEVGFVVIVLVGKPLKAKGSGDIISFELKLSIFFLDSFRKKLSIFFCTFDTSFQLFLYDNIHVFVSVYFL